MRVYIVHEDWHPAEIQSIEGYVTSEEEAIKLVKKLDKEHTYNHTYTEVIFIGENNEK